MKSIWGEEKGEGLENVAGSVQTLAEGGKARLSEPPRSSRPPLNASPEERRLYSVFAFLRGKENLVKKAEYAEDVLNGEYGIKNELLAKLMMGPRQLKEILDDPRDVVPPLLELMENRDVGIRVKLAQVLGEKGDERALLRMYAGLAEEEYWVRHEFSTALGKMASRMVDGGTVSEIFAVMKDCAERKEGISSGLLRVERHLKNIEKDGGWKEAPKTLREPPPMVVIRETVVEPRSRGPDTTVRISTGVQARPDTTARIIRKK